MWGHTKDKTFHPVCAESPSSTIRVSSNPLFLLAPHNSIPHSTAWHIVHKIVAVTRFCLHVQRLSVVYTLYNICTYGLFLYVWNVVCLHFQTHMIAGVDFITNLIIVFTHNSRHRPTILRDGSQQHQLHRLVLVGLHRGRFIPNRCWKPL